MTLKFGIFFIACYSQILMKYLLFGYTEVQPKLRFDHRRWPGSNLSSEICSRDQTLSRLLIGQVKVHFFINFHFIIKKFTDFNKPKTPLADYISMDLPNISKPLNIFIHFKTFGGKNTGYTSVRPFLYFVHFHMFGLFCTSTHRL